MTISQTLYPNRQLKVNYFGVGQKRAYRHPSFDFFSYFACNFLHSRTHGSFYRPSTKISP